MRIFNEIVELTVSNSDESKAEAVSNELPVREAVIGILPDVEGTCTRVVVATHCWDLPFWAYHRHQHSQKIL
jgi:hypothetical protein